MVVVCSGTMNPMVLPCGANISPLKNVSVCGKIGGKENLNIKFH